MEHKLLPQELFEGLRDDDGVERAARIGRWLVLQEMGFLGEESNLNLALGKYKGTFIAAVRRKFSNVYGNTDGCSPGDIEVAMELLEVMDDIYDADLANK